MSGPATPVLPDLSLGRWEATRTTLHLWSQIVGKVRLAATPRRNHWWHTTLYVDIAGLTTRRLHLGETAFQVDLDLLAHRLLIRTGDGRQRSFPLVDGLSVARFHAGVQDALRSLGLDVGLVGRPFGISTETPFAEDEQHASYDPDAVVRFFRALEWADALLDELASGFLGKASPVQLYWHSFDLSLALFSGRPAATPDETDAVTREATSHEVVELGFWPGDAQTPTAFYASVSPLPAGLADRSLVPADARWQQLPSGLRAVLPYDAVRTAQDPRATLIAFLESAFDAASGASGWDLAALRAPWSRRAVDTS